MILNKYQYVNKIIPDLSYVDYAEKCYWQAQPSDRMADNIWYYVHNHSAATQVKDEQVQSYRCIIVSPIQLAFTLSQDQTLVELSKYNDRFVYVFFDSDDENTRQLASFPKAKYSCTRSDMNEYPYIIELRF